MFRLAPVFLGVLALAACDFIPGFGTPGPEVVAPAQAKLSSGDLPGAAADYASLASEHEDSVHVAVGQAYMQMLQGDLPGADATLAKAEESAGDKVGEIKLRRALIALKQGNLDTVKVHGTASGLPEGKLLAAEVHLVDLESDEAAALLREVSSVGGAIGQTAAKYLEMVDSGDQIMAGLAEASALWALGERETASANAEELVRALPSDYAEKPELLLVWAGRAVTSGHPENARAMLDEIAFPPEGQAWRVQATRALVSVAMGEVDQGIKLLNALAEGGAPADGVADARATACALTEEKAKAREIVGELESPAIAKCLEMAGAAKVAPGRAPAGPLRTYLESK